MTTNGFRLCVEAGPILPNLAILLRTASIPRRRLAHKLETFRWINSYSPFRLGPCFPLLLWIPDPFDTAGNARMNPNDKVLSSAKVRLCGSWAAKLATRASDVNFTVLLQPSSFFDMVDAKVCTTPSRYSVYFQLALFRKSSPHNSDV